MGSNRPQDTSDLSSVDPRSSAPADGTSPRALGRLGVGLAICLSLVAIALSGLSLFRKGVPPVDGVGIGWPAPLPGVIGADGRVPLAQFTPDDPYAFPEWQDVAAGVVRLNCDGGPVGGGVLIGSGLWVLTAAHIFIDDDGRPDPARRACVAVHTGGDSVLLHVDTLRSGRFFVPDPLSDSLSADITANDWAIVALARPLRGARVLPFADPERFDLVDGTAVLNLTGPQDNLVGNGFFAQSCAYRGIPPLTWTLSEDGVVTPRANVAGDLWRLARYDCDIGLGASGSPVIAWQDGQGPVILGILTDSLRGLSPCAEIGRDRCYSAGPLVGAMRLDLLPEP